MKKKIVTLILIILSIFSSIKPMEMKQTNSNQKSIACVYVPKEIWKEILLILVNSTDNLEDLKKSMRDILNFALVSKECLKIVNEIADEKYPITNQEQETCKSKFIKILSDAWKYINKHEINLKLKQIYSSKAKEINKEVLFLINTWLKSICCNFKNINILVNNNQVEDINDKIFSGDTLLITATSYENKEITELLLKNSVDTNIKNSEGGTALTIAVFRNNKEIVELLLRYGADTNIKIGNTTLLNYAIQYGYQEIEQLIKNYEEQRKLRK